MKKFWLFCSLCCVCFNGFGQGSTPQPISRDAILSHMYSMDTSLFYIETQAMNYIANNPNDSSFTKKFGRWVMFWEDRVDENGNFDSNFTTVLSNAQSSLNKNNPVCNQNGTWNQVGPYCTGQKSGIVVSVYSPKSNPNIIYIGSNSSGLWKTIDGGLTWNNMTDDLRLPSLGINSIVGDPNDPNKLFIATGFNSNYIPGSYGLGVLVSYDGGFTWYETGLNWSTHSWDAIAVDKLVVNPSDDKIWALSADGVYELSASSLSGTGTTIWDKIVNIGSTSTWSNLLDVSNLSSIHNGNDFTDMEFVPSNTQIMFLSTRLKGNLTNNAGRLYKSTNGGSSWTLINNLPTTTNNIGICVIEAAEEDPDVSE